MKKEENNSCFVSPHLHVSTEYFHTFCCFSFTRLQTIKGKKLFKLYRFMIRLGLVCYTLPFTDFYREKFGNCVTKLNF